MNPQEFVIVQTTTDSADEVQQLAAAAVEHQLAACVQVSQVQSYYRWEGKVHQDPEFLLSFKTTYTAISKIQEFLAQQHSYDEPELIVIPIIDGSQGYLDWMRDSVTP
ncbi:MAG TPA: divalent-cation tolerance protein CutA [Enteractinococcus sp.]